MRSDDRELCLPVFTNRAGSVVAAAHAGWRGLLAGVLSHSWPPQPARRTRAGWCGPAISRDAFEVGSEVRAAAVAHNPAAAAAFSPLPDGKWLADLPGLAASLLAAGVPDNRCVDSELCTVIEREFFAAATAAPAAWPA
ncbi:MAG: laccase domain-containing protein [Rivihabitans pingtungensis]